MLVVISIIRKSSDNVVTLYGVFLGKQTVKKLAVHTVFGGVLALCNGFYPYRYPLCSVLEKTYSG